MDLIVLGIALLSPFSGRYAGSNFQKIKTLKLQNNERNVPLHFHVFIPFIFCIPKHLQQLFNILTLSNTFQNHFYMENKIIP